MMITMIVITEIKALMGTTRFLLIFIINLQSSLISISSVFNIGICSSCSYRQIVDYWFIQ